jgi:hypothetical protein
MLVSGFDSKASFSFKLVASAASGGASGSRSARNPKSACSYLLASEDAP